MGLQHQDVEIHHQEVEYHQEGHPQPHHPRPPHQEMVKTLMTIMVTQEGILEAEGWWETQHEEGLSEEEEHDQGEDREEKGQN